MQLSNVEYNGNAVVAATVTGVVADDVLAAEYRAERFLGREAEKLGKVVSCDRWEIGGREENIYVIKFHCEN